MSRYLKIWAALLTLSLALPTLSRGQAASQNGGLPPQPSVPSPTDRAPERQSDQVANIPYFTLRDGLSSTLTLNNNAATPTTVSVTIFNRDGHAQTLDPITLDPHLFTQIELRDVIKSDDFDEGNVSVAYYGTEMGVTTQVSVYSLERRISFESREQGMFDFESTVSNGILYLPQKEAQGFLALTNVSKNNVTAQLTVGATKKDIVLYSRETRLVKLNADLGEDEHPPEGSSRSAPTSSLIRLQHNGLPGNVITQGFVLNQKAGYSSSFTMVDSKVMRSSHLAGAHIRFGTPGLSEGFPEGTSFTSPLLLANVSDKPVVAHVSVDYTVTEKLAMTPIDPKAGDTLDKFSTVAVKDVTIAPGDIQRVELADELAKLGVPTPVKEAGVEITHEARPGSLIGHLVSADQTGDYSFEVPIKDAMAGNAMIEGIYPWTLENGARTVLHLKNTTDQPLNAWTTISFPGGTYNLPLLSFEPYQTIPIDIQALKDSRKPDARGIPFPANATHGQIVWFPQEPFTLVGRAEQTNLSEGIARSFSCQLNCCSNYDESTCLSSSASCSPASGLTGDVGGSGALAPYVYGTDCNNNPFGTNLG